MAGSPFLVDHGSKVDAAVARTARHRLHRNRRNRTFEDVTSSSVIRHREYGMGARAGDYDNDGLVDLYITNVGPNVLYRNSGGGAFTDVTQKAGSPRRCGERAVRLPTMTETLVSICLSPIS